MQYDYHLHTSFSSDSKTPMEIMIQRALSLGMKGICFTEHHDLNWPENKDGLTFLLDTDRYEKKLFELKEKYRQSIDICFGVELGLCPDLKKTLLSYVHHYPFDFIIGSSHLVDGIDPYDPKYFKQFKDEKQGFYRYFKSILENLDHFTEFDVYGHLDYVVRYAPHKDNYYQYSDYTDILDLILKKCISHQIGLELNTAGLKYGMREPNPSIPILKRYKELGGEILTIGSDGHLPEHMAWNFKQVPAFLKTAGFSYFTIFKKRTPIFLPIDKE